MLLAISDNGPQMTSTATAVFMAGVRIAQHFGRPSTPNDQAWVESFGSGSSGASRYSAIEPMTRAAQVPSAPFSTSVCNPSCAPSASRIRLADAKTPTPSMAQSNLAPWFIKRSRYMAWVR